MSFPADLSIPAPRSSVENQGPTPEAETPAGSLSLLLNARTCLHEAEQAEHPGERYVSAHVAALRAATAVVVARSRQREQGRPASVWTLLIEAAPELREWAAYFAARSDRRAAAEAGVPTITWLDADGLLARSREFLDIVGRSLLGVAR
ncbi:SAV_6107 family HEPN domain-containing protein [Saccharopolyspora oryzae]|uniref:SAV_6107 family HEPN domain-containing protein n=1 Tax=Saccharopolyspora oryzae TaxID=2997343 RepID=A0ABT4V7G9_9PSEU|nr:SAV_6107 family HEPN domain-containing protein [Saccharopolyspora oryzae]MDA3629921.1 SAV_6107 family HEPN domain-containing protein [Saccharopolyspora oryzae]